MNTQQRIAKNDTFPGVLLVDDEPNVLSSLRRLLRKVDCTLYTALSGKEGLDILAEHDIDIVISDARMPEMTGPEFLAIVAEEYPDSTRILLTGYADMEAMADAINRGKVSQYIEKPWDDEKLVALVQDTLMHVDVLKQNQALQQVIKEQNETLKAMNENLEATVKERSAKIILMNNALKENYRHTLNLFSGLLEMRLPKASTELPDIVLLVKDMAALLEVPEHDIAALEYATKMRYIGLMGLSDTLLKTPYERLTKDQKHIYEQYPLMGSAVLTSIPHLRAASDIILQHKEYLNGRGYPHGEWEKNLSRRVQILTVANDYIELVSGRMQEEALTHVEALHFLATRSGSFYAENVIEALKQALSLQEVSKQKGELRVWSKHLVPGMILSRDLSNHNGAFLLAKGAVLNDRLIMRLIKLEVRAQEEFMFFVVVPDGVDVPEEIKQEIQMQA